MCERKGRERKGRERKRAALEREDWDYGKEQERPIEIRCGPIKKELNSYFISFFNLFLFTLLL